MNPQTGESNDASQEKKRLLNQHNLPARGHKPIIPGVNRPAVRVLQMVPNRRYERTFTGKNTPTDNMNSQPADTNGPPPDEKSLLISRKSPTRAHKLSNRRKQAYPKIERRTMGKIRLIPRIKTLTESTETPTPGQHQTIPMESCRAFQSIRIGPLGPRSDIGNILIAILALHVWNNPGSKQYVDVTAESAGNPGMGGGYYPSWLSKAYVLPFFYHERTLPGTLNPSNPPRPAQSA